MQFSKIMIAVATLAVGSAMAAPVSTRIAISSGASASKGNLLLALQNRCGGTLTEFAVGSNQSTYVCATGAVTSGSAGTYAGNADSTFTNFTGTGFAELRLNVAGGSFTAACLLAGWPQLQADGVTPTACPVADLYVNPASDTLATLEVAPTGSTAVGGLMDVEPTAFLSTVRAGIATPGSVISANFGQTFGVAVSNDLYTAMFNDQLAAGTLHSTCAVSDTKIPACVPVIGKAQVASIMSGSTGSDAYLRGANFLAPSSVASGTALTYARRGDTSGTQAAAQQYFLGNVCNTQGISVVAAGTVANAITVQNLSSTGAVRTQLNLTGHSIGIMSGENNQSGQSWKWVRVGGMNMAESAAPNEAGVAFTNTATALNGQYDYWFLSRVAKPAGTLAGSAGALSTAFWNSVITGFGAVAVNNTKGLFKTTETKFTRGTVNSCKPAFTN